MDNDVSKEIAEKLNTLFILINMAYKLAGLLGGVPREVGELGMSCVHRHHDFATRFQNGEATKELVAEIDDAGAAAVALLAIHEAIMMERLSGTGTQTNAPAPTRQSVAN